MPIAKLNGQGPMVAAIISGLVSGGGISAALPKMAPEWYRQDPYTSAMARQANRRLEDDINRLDQKFEIFILAGPTLIRANQEKMLDLLKELHDSALRHSARCGEEHM